MFSRFYLFCSLILLTSPPGHAKPSDFSFVGIKSISEKALTFKYSSNDGTFQLNCSHTFDKPELHDWSVWCGKGTHTPRHFRVHFLVRQYESSNSNRSAFEVLYWVIDRNQPMDRAFSSTSSWLQFKNRSQLEIFSFSQGVENDYAYLTVELKP